MSSRILPALSFIHPDTAGSNPSSTLNGHAVAVVVVVVAVVVVVVAVVVVVVSVVVEVAVEVVVVAVVVVVVVCTQIERSTRASIKSVLTRSENVSRVWAYTDWLTM